MSKQNTKQITSRARSKVNSKLADESVASETDTSLVDSPVVKTKKQTDKVKHIDKQSTLDKHLATGSPIDFSDMWRKLQDRLDLLASKEYLESKFKEMISESVLNDKLNELRSYIESEVKKELDTVNKEFKILNDRATAMETTILECRNKVSDLEVKTEKLHIENEKLKKQNQLLEEKSHALLDRILVSEATNNNLEQYTRRNSIRIYGIEDNVSETEEETCNKVQKLLNNKLGISLSIRDLDTAHRLGAFRSDGNRVIICKFVQRILKKQVLKARRALKGFTIIIREDRTKANARLLEQVSNHDKVKASWSDEGRIIVLLKNNKKFTVRRLQDLDKVNLESKFPDLQSTRFSTTGSAETESTSF